LDFVAEKLGGPIPNELWNFARIYGSGVFEAGNSIQIQ
jgi:hypothetical protein